MLVYRQKNYSSLNPLGNYNGIWGIVEGKKKKKENNLTIRIYIYIYIYFYYSIFNREIFDDEI